MKLLSEIFISIFNFISFIAYFILCLFFSALPIAIAISLVVWLIG